MNSSKQKRVAKPHSSLSEKFDALSAKLDRLEDDFSKYRSASIRREARLNSEIMGLKLQIKQKDQKIEDLEKSNTYLKNRLFGSQSERNASKPVSIVGSVKDKTPRRRGQQPGSEGHGRSLKSVEHKREVQVEVSETCCSACSKAFKILDATKDSKLIEFHQFLEETTYKRQVAVSQCNCFGKTIRVADLPRKLFPRTEVGNTLWTHFLLSKYLFGVPTNRVQKALSLRGVTIPLGTLTGGFKHINGLLDGLYECMKEHAQYSNLWNADETSWRVMDAERRRHWLWVIASSDSAIYLIDQSRSSKVPATFFENSEGTLITDRYSAYKALSERIDKAWCWVHVRRDFLTLANGIKKHKRWADKWLARIGKLFAANHLRFKILEESGLETDEWDHANERLRQLLERFQKEFKREISENLLEDQQLKILRSLNRHWDGLTLFKRDPRIPMDNNRAERLLRGGVVLRKNSYGSGTSWSGQLLAKTLTLFHTWLLNGLDPEAMLEDFLDASSIGAPAINLDEYLPWRMSNARKQEFALPAAFTKPS